MKFLILCVCLWALVTADYQPNWASLDARPLPAWYDESKFGVFLHWGVYSVPSYDSEWFWWDWQGAKEKNVIQFMEDNYPPGFQYADFAPMFHAELYDADEWAKLFAEAGVKYVVLTSKHHEGFTNWPSKYSWNWNSMDVGPHKDLLGELATAIRGQNIHFGTYYSLFEWFNSLYLQDKANNFSTQVYVADVMLPQMYELVNTYKPDLIWSDGDWEAHDTYWNSTEFLAWLYNDSPVKDTVVVNDRWGSGDACHHGGYYTCQDRYNPGKLQNHKYENAMTVQKTSWGYIRNTNISGYLTIEELLNELVSTVSTNGNLLMNVGPNHDGRIMPIFQERLLQMGAWLKTNGEAIYSSKPWQYQNDSATHDVWYTRNTAGDTIYATLLSWPNSSTVLLGDVVSTSDTTVNMLGWSGALKWQMETGKGLMVTLPNLPPNTPLQWAWTLKLLKVTPRSSEGRPTVFANTL